MIEYCYFNNFLFKTVDNQIDYYICPKFHNKWMEVDDDAISSGIYPSNDYEELSEQEALQFALTLGMDEASFNAK